MTETYPPAQPRDDASSEFWGEPTERGRSVRRKAGNKPKPATPDGNRRRLRVFPRSVIGIALTLAALGVGAGVSGAVLFAYYDSRVAQTSAQLEGFNADLDRRVNEALGVLNETSTDVANQLETGLGPYRALLQNADGISAVGSAVQASVVLVETSDTDGAPVVGTATAVAADGDATIVLTSLSVVRAGTAEPGPPITVVAGDQRSEATVFNWDDTYDLALLRVPLPLQPVAFSSVAEAGSLTGSPVYAVSGFAATVTPGTVVGVTASGMRYLALLGRDFAGAPLVDPDGRLVGVVTPSYAPGGLDGDLRWSPTLAQLCTSLLTCSDGVEVVGR